MSMGSILITDGYKFSMAEAGWPLRKETFYYSHRFGGAMVVPLDLEEYIRSCVRELTTVDSEREQDLEYLASHDYSLGIGVRTALQSRDDLKIWALPKYSVFQPHEPVFSVTGPSALVSWLEPRLLWLHYQFQIATIALREKGRLEHEIDVVTCPAQKEIICKTLDAIKVKAPKIQVNEDGYFQDVLRQVKSLVEAVKEPNRIFEVGLRSATCLQQHEIALRACQEAGVHRTSNVSGAKYLAMIPVGTMGHEHIQRYGNDEDAFRAMRDRRPYRSSYLLDTFDTFRSGIPAAFKVMKETPGHQDSIRYDSGDKKSQYLYAVAKAKDEGLNPVHIFEDAFDLEKTKEMELLRQFTNVKPMEQHYGYGGFIVARPSLTSLTRDRVAANFKLSQTGPRATMKFSNDPAKESIPGRPVVFRRLGHPDREPFGVIGQEGEKPPQGYQVQEGSNGIPDAEYIGEVDDAEASILSPQTEALRQEAMKKSGLFSA